MRYQIYCAFICLLLLAGLTTAGDKSENKMEKATFAAGCFWGVEATFRQIDGVTQTNVGYTGGQVADPTYKQVCSDETGHAEAIEIQFDPKIVTYRELLTVFWDNHDPTTLNRQGPDFGSQYRSAVYYHSPTQKEMAEELLSKLADSGKYSRKIVTEITQAGQFYIAEEYHQQYLEKRGMSSCHINLNTADEK